MIHPFLRVVATQPQLLVDHAEAYAGLVGEELGKSAARLKRRILLLVLAAFFAAAAILFAGIALMLWAVSAPAQIHASWLLIATPAVPALIAVVCAITGRSSDGPAFAQLKQQLASDLALMREVSAA